MSESYEKFLMCIQQLADVEHAQALLSWDQETYMPPRGTAMRARAQGTMAGLAHEMLVDDQLVNLVRDLQAKTLEGDQAVHQHLRLRPFLQVRQRG